MRKKLMALLMTFMFSFTFITPGFADGGSVPASEKIGAMEIMLYGTEQSGSLIQRMDSLEDDVYGTITSDAILARVDNMLSLIHI